MVRFFLQDRPVFRAVSMIGLDVWETVKFLTLLVNANMGLFWAVFWVFVNMLGHIG